MPSKLKSISILTGFTVILLYVKFSEQALLKLFINEILLDIGVAVLPVAVIFLLISYFLTKEPEETNNQIKRNF